MVIPWIFILENNLFPNSGEALPTRSSSNILELIGLIALFIILVIVCYFVTRFVGNRQMNQTKNSNFKVIESYKVSSNKFLQLICIANHYYVLAITKDQVTLIAELEEAEIVKAQSLETQHTFVNVLSQFTKKKKENEKVDMNDDYNE